MDGGAVGWVGLGGGVVTFKVVLLNCRLESIEQKNKISIFFHAQKPQTEHIFAVISSHE